MKPLAVLLIWLALASSAFAQLPGVELPSLPPVQELPDRLGDETQTLRDRLDLRRLRIEERLRLAPRELERGPRGELIVRAEVLAWSPTPAALNAARSAGFTIVREDALEELGARIVVLRAPHNMSTARALRRLRGLDPDGAYDFNHIYVESGETTPPPLRPPLPLPAPRRVGLIDGGLDSAHPTFRGVSIQQRGFIGAARPSAHAAATGSLLIGGAGAGTLYVADVYCGAPTGGSASTVARALAWMAAEDVGVINVSLVGPANRTLQAAVLALQRRGHVIVAAVGNDGPAARPLYPAAYDGVVGVTAVDRRRRVLLEAGRGAHVDFAALGSDVSAASTGGGFVSVRGTSFAAPLVARLLAERLDRSDRAEAERAIALLAQSALDLGPRGRDNIYGAGLLGRELTEPR
jgi:cysteine synthase